MKSKEYWLAMAYVSLSMANYKPSEILEMIDKLTGDYRDVEKEFVDKVMKDLGINQLP